MKIWSDALSHLNVTGKRYVNYVEKSLRGTYSDDDDGNCDSRVVGFYNPARYQDRDDYDGPEDDDNPRPGHYVPKPHEKCPGCFV